MKNRKLAFFGGCFNPPTIAHIELAKKVVEELDIDHLYFVPMNDHFHKVNLISQVDRYQMLELICKDYDKLDVSDVELKIDRQIKPYEAFEIIRESFPEDSLYFIIGADNFIRMKQWDHFTQLMNKYQFVILERQNIDIHKEISENEILQSNKDQFHIIQSDYINLKATDIRSGIYKGNIKGIVDMIYPEVLEYIQENKLFIG